MTTNTGELILQKLSWRYATKGFDPSRKISPEDWAVLEKAMILAPSSYGLQPWQFIVVTDQAVKDRLPAAAWGQTQPKDCSHFVVIAARRATEPGYVQKLIEATADKREVPASTLDGYKQSILGKTTGMKDGHWEWNSRQCYIALGFLLESAALMGIDACPMEGILRDKMDEALGLVSSEYSSTVACSLGYRAIDDKYAEASKVRYPAIELVRHI